MPKNHGKANKERKRAEAITRQEEYDKLTPQQIILQLNKMFGEGNGAKKQRGKLVSLLREEKINPETKKNKKT